MDADDPTLKTPVNGNREHKPKNASNPQFAPGDLIAGVYQVISFIGAGGMSNVYKCRDISLDRIVAVKALQSGYTEESLRRFQTEGKAVARLDHLHIVKLYGLQTNDDGEPVLVMEYISGQTLSDVIKKNPHLPVERVLNIAKQICDALSLSEREGIVHRDLKPSNIMLTGPGTPNECVKVLDFGIAKIRDSANHDATKTGDIFGTPNYMSPEQALGKRCDARADQYALGCILFEMLSGRPPFTSENILSVILMHVQNPVPNLNEVTTKHLPAHLAQIVRKMMQKKPDDRFADFEGVARALDTVGEKTARDSRKLVLYSVVPIVFVAMMAGLFYKMHTHDTSAPNRGTFSVAPDFMTTRKPQIVIDAEVKALDSIKSVSSEQDARLNEKYAAVIRKYGHIPAFKEKLRIAEQCWIDFRIAHLKSIYPDENNRELDGSACFEVQLTKASRVRTIELDKMLSSPMKPATSKTGLTLYDSKMEDAYQKALQKYAVADPKFLREAQAKWLTYRDADAELQSVLAKPGESSGVKIAALTYLDVIRLTELNQWVEGVREGKLCAGTRPIRTSGL